MFYLTHINFLISLFWGSQDTSFVKCEKLKCLVNYFNRVNEDFDHFAGVITFERRVLSNMIRPDWRNSDKKLTHLKVESTGTIDQDGKGFSQVDFASSSIGSNVLHGMCLREEILFLTHPELIVARLFTEKLNDQESLIVTGCAQFNECLGYANSFKWSADKREELSLDGWGRPHRQFVLIDALEYRQRHTQYKFDKIERELNKAFCGFHDSSQYRLRVRPAIASGNWGCGAFNGDTYLKSLIQLLAASEAERDLILFTFNDNYTKNEVKRFYEIMRERNHSVKDITRVMERHPFPNSESRFEFNYLSFLLTKFELSSSPA